jgi:hypothetical protein
MKVLQYARFVIEGFQFLQKLSLWTRHPDLGIIMVAVYIDDFLVVGTEKAID